MSNHTVSTASGIYYGGVYYANYHKGDIANRRGIKAPNQYAKEFGAVATADADGVVNGGTATATGGTTFTLATSAGLVSTAGTATFDVPRNVVIGATGAVTSATGVTFTITGTDEYGETVIETISGPDTATGGGSSSAGTKAFKTVTGATADSATSEPINIGSGNVLGLPYKLANKGEFLGLRVDGVETTPTLVVGMATGTTALATNGDVRGTVTMPTGSVPNGSKYFTVQALVPRNQRRLDVFGVDQYDG